MCPIFTQHAIAKKESYLDEAKADRQQLNMSMRQISDWISGAEDMLDSGYDGLDYDTLNDTLSEHKVCQYIQLNIVYYYIPLFGPIFSLKLRVFELKK